MVKEKKREVKQERVRPKFKSCETALLGGFDPFGNEPGRNPNGSTCSDGMRTWWSRTSADSDQLERVSGRCKCLRTYLALNPASVVG